MVTPWEVLFLGLVLEFQEYYNKSCPGIIYTNTIIVHTSSIYYYYCTRNSSSDSIHSSHCCYYFTWFQILKDFLHTMYTDLPSSDINMCSILSLGAEAQRAQQVLKEPEKICLFAPPIRIICLGTLLLFYSTLMSLAPISVVHPGTNLL